MIVYPVSRRERFIIQGIRIGVLLFCMAFWSMMAAYVWLRYG